MRSKKLVVGAVMLGLAAFLPAVPAGQAEAQEDPGIGGDPTVGGSPSPSDTASEFPGFTAVDSYAQGQAATGYFFAVGEEENRLVGAQSVINGPPAGSGNVAAFFQRGVAATYTYGLIGGGGPGKNGMLPEPPPGQASAFFPANPPESTWSGPVTTGAGGPVADGRFYAKATRTPTGVSEATLSHYEQPGAFKFDQADVKSHTEPAEGGVASESTSILRGVTIGPIFIESLVSHAQAFVPSASEAPTGVATTVANGVTVNGTPVKITEKGIVVGDQASPGAQDGVNAALAEAGLGDVRLTACTVKVGEKNDSIAATAGGVRIVYRDPAFANQNPQGFYGGGFSMGGADVKILGRRASAKKTAPGGY